MPSDPGELVAPERNHYFYGLLMDAGRFQKDQDYFNRKRALLNRFVCGPGVICGLDLTFNGANGVLTLSPGVAIDLAGREIVVPVSTTVDTSQLTDTRGRPTGSVPAGSTTIVSIAYAERCADPVAVLVPDCDHPDGCAPSTIREGFAILVRLASGAPPQPPADAGLLFLASDADLQAKIAKWVAGHYAPAPAEASIALGRLSLPGGPLDAVSDRSVVYDNTLLFQLVMSLAAEVSRLAVVTLTYVSGDNQSAKPGQALTAPLVVELTDQGGKPVTGSAAPQFTVTAGGGSLGPTTATAQPGQFQTIWTLGAAGAQTVTAHATASALTVTFRASIAP